MKILKKIKRWLNPLYSVVYRTADGRTEMYTIDRPSHANEFGNREFGLKTAGFRTFCHNKQGIRSFRYDRIISLNKS